MNSSNSGARHETSPSCLSMKTTGMQHVNMIQVHRLVSRIFVHHVCEFMFSGVRLLCFFLFFVMFFVLFIYFVIVYAFSFCISWQSEFKYAGRRDVDTDIAQMLCRQLNGGSLVCFSCGKDGRENILEYFKERDCFQHRLEVFTQVKYPDKCSGEFVPNVCVWWC